MNVEWGSAGEAEARAVSEVESLENETDFLRLIFSEAAPFDETLPSELHLFGNFQGVAFTRLDRHIIRFKRHTEAVQRASAILERKAQITIVFCYYVRQVNEHA